MNNINSLLNSLNGLFHQVDVLEVPDNFKSKNEKHYVNKNQIEQNLNKSISKLDKNPLLKNQIREIILSDCFGSKQFEGILFDALGEEEVNGTVCGKVLTSGDSAWVCKDCE